MTVANGSEPKGGASIFWLVYSQVAAMLGALSILVFLTHFFDVGPRGIILDAYTTWVTYVRGPVGSALQFIVDLLSLRVDVGPIAKDYFAVGLVAAGSAVRVLRLNDNGPILLIEATIIFVAFVLLWPLVVVVGAILTIIVALASFGSGHAEPNAEVGGAYAIWLTPMVYLGLLFAANAWLPA